MAKFMNVQSLGEMVSAALDGEPVFIIRAQDKLAIKALSHYSGLAREVNAHNFYRTNKAIAQFEQWQQANEAKVRIPD